jgi:hypothetical protein
MKIRNSRLWRSDSSRSNEGNNTSPIALKEQSDQNQNQNQDPSSNLKITKVEITFHIQRRSINLRNLLLLRFNNQKNRD